MGHSHPKLVKWAAQDGRVNDLVFHLSGGGVEALRANGDPKRQTPMHLAAIGGHMKCIRVLWEAGLCYKSIRLISVDPFMFPILILNFDLFAM